jgi:hypothetical protein
MQTSCVGSCPQNAVAPRPASGPRACAKACQATLQTALNPAQHPRPARTSRLRALTRSYSCCAASSAASSADTSFCSCATLRALAASPPTLLQARGAAGRVCGRKCSNVCTCGCWALERSRTTASNAAGDQPGRASGWPTCVPPSPPAAPLPASSSPGPLLCSAPSAAPPLAPAARRKQPGQGEQEAGGPGPGGALQASSAGGDGKAPPAHPPTHPPARPPTGDIASSSCSGSSASMIWLLARRARRLCRTAARPTRRASAATERAPTPSSLYCPHLLPSSSSYFPSFTRLRPKSPTTAGSASDRRSFQHSAGGMQAMTALSCYASTDWRELLRTPPHPTPPCPSHLPPSPQTP